MCEMIISNNLICVETAWYNTVGFVLCQDKITREYKIYTYKMGGDYNDEYTEKQDTEKIMAHGSTFPLATASSLFRWNIEEDWVHQHIELFL